MVVSMSPTTDPYAGIRTQLESIAEQLADIALERIRDQFEADPDAAKAEEKRVSKARRAVLKAANDLSV